MSPVTGSFYLQAVHDAADRERAAGKAAGAECSPTGWDCCSTRCTGGSAPRCPDRDRRVDTDPLVTPIDAEFRVGTMGLGWDADAGAVVVELLAVTETEVDESVVLDDTEEGPDAVRVFLTPVQAREFAARSDTVIAAGRAPCPLCGEPLGPATVTCASAPTVTSAPPASTRRPVRRRADVGAVAGPRSVLTEGELTVVGRVAHASNATLVCDASCGEHRPGVSTSRSAANGRCGTSRTARWPAGRSRRT